MKINANCVDEALFQGLELLTSEGIRQQSRAGEVLAMSYPVMTCNNFPMNRVSFNSKRDANPFFHLMEALWMLAGRNDATWLDQFVGDFSSRFAEEGGRQHGAYGFRWRKHFELEGGGGHPDQLDKAVKLLKKNPDDRRVVITMWDPMADLMRDKRDIPCNTHIYLRIRGDRGMRDLGHGNVVDFDERVLDLTVCCRSNDAVWGAHGANAVHFSVLQEYLAARIGVGIGKLYQLSNNYHVYTSILNKVWPMEIEEGADIYYKMPHAFAHKIVEDPENFDADLKSFFGDHWDLDGYSNPFFHKIAIPFRESYALWRAKDYRAARYLIHQAPICDWSIAAASWYHRRINGHLQEDQR